MDRDSSDEDLEIEKVCSQSEAKVYTEVPSDTNYKFKLNKGALMRRIWGTPCMDLYPACLILYSIRFFV